jgi:murein tripeptide amidase MpaA
MLQRTISIAAVILVLGACASVEPSFAPLTACKTAEFTLLDDFPGARRGRCVVVAANHVRLAIVPEDEGYVNDSPWYAFKLIPEQASTAIITLQYRHGHHRYAPKISHDGVHWSNLDARDVKVSYRYGQATISIKTGKQPFWIAAQELITPQAYASWSREMAATGLTDLAVLGYSPGGAAIPVLKANSAADDVLLLIGRQHPPEVTGAIAFFSFYETLMADSKLARRFRQRFNIIAVPMLNPDGVIGGNWRHNLCGADLNQDWGQFRQAETQLVAALLDQLDASGKKPRVFLDFHSTNRNIFYTQEDVDPATPQRFSHIWLENAQRRIQGYEFSYGKNPVSAAGASKNYMYARYGIPSTTYEVDDNIDRDAIRQAATIFAEELMSLMLQQDYQ